MVRAQSNPILATEFFFYQNELKSNDGFRDREVQTVGPLPQQRLTREHTLPFLIRCGILRR